MIKKTRHKEQKIQALPKHRLTDILPFTESPSRNRYRSNATKNKKELGASDLFSMFTANIIKEDVIFTR
ncbi:MAG TPA: hypothetical protein VFD56_15415 [Chitinophagaceae bacterium]|nr:hypothetical protein [Chitinophagaceae bacterium]